MTVESVTQIVDSRKSIYVHLISSHLLNKLYMLGFKDWITEKVFWKVDTLKDYFFPNMCYEMFFPSDHHFSFRPQLITCSVNNTFRLTVTHLD